MPSIAILTPDPADEGFRTRWRDVFARNAAPLERAAIAVEGRCWVGGDLAGFDLVMPLLTWGYHRAGTQWHAAVDAWAAADLPVRNPASVLHWNADKRYLGTLARRGGPVVPTRYVERLTLEEMEAAAAAFGTDRLIAKPQVSASAWQTIRWSPGAPLDGGPSGAAMIQPFLPSISTEGELSLLWFGGAFSHAIRKRPQPGDFRVQPEYDGIITAHVPAADEMACAEAILGAIEEDLLYARIDLVRGLDGAPALMELELVEPDLYLEHDPAAGAAFVDSVRRAAA